MLSIPPQQEPTAAWPLRDVLEAKPDVRIIVPRLPSSAGEFLAISLAARRLALN